LQFVNNEAKEKLEAEKVQKIEMSLKVEEMTR